MIMEPRWLDCGQVACFLSSFRIPITPQAIYWSGSAAFRKKNGPSLSSALDPGIASARGRMGWLLRLFRPAQMSLAVELHISMQVQGYEIDYDDWHKDVHGSLPYNELIQVPLSPFLHETLVCLTFPLDLHSCRACSGKQ